MYGKFKGFPDSALDGFVFDHWKMAAVFFSDVQNDWRNESSEWKNQLFLQNYAKMPTFSA